MSVQAEPLPASLAPQRLHLFWLALYAILDLSWIWHDQLAYSVSSLKYDGVLAGTGCAPEQYRVGAAFAARWVARLLHLHTFVAGSIVIDLLGAWLLSLLLYSLLNQRLQGQSPAVSSIARAFLGLWMLFYLHWSYGSARVETIPNCLYIAFSLFLLHRLLSSSGTARIFCIAGLLAAALLEGWVRADVAVVLAAGICVAALLPQAQHSTAQRLGTFTVGALAGVLSGGSLLYLMRVVYPHAHYCCSVWALDFNLAHSYAYIPFFTLMPPILLGMWAVLRNFRNSSMTDRVVLFSTAMYIVVWSCVGNWGEARIIVPFAMGILPIVCTSMAGLLLQPSASPSLKD